MPLKVVKAVNFVPCMCVRAKSLQSCPTLLTPWTGAHQAPLSMGFSRQECWRGVPCPPPGDLPPGDLPSGDRPDPGIEPVSLADPAPQAESLPLGHGEALCCVYCTTI